MNGWDFTSEIGKLKSLLRQSRFGRHQNHVRLELLLKDFGMVLDRYPGLRAEFEHHANVIELTTAQSSSLAEALKEVVRSFSPETDKIGSRDRSFFCHYFAEQMGSPATTYGEIKALGEAVGYASLEEDSDETQGALSILQNEVDGLLRQFVGLKHDEVRAFWEFCTDFESVESSLNESTKSQETIDAVTVGIEWLEKTFQAMSDAEKSSRSLAKPKNTRRGRPKGTRSYDVDLDQQIVKAWKNGKGQFKSKGELDKAFNQPVGYSRRAIDRERKRKSS